MKYLAILYDGDVDLYWNIVNSISCTVMRRPMIELSPPTNHIYMLLSINTTEQRIERISVPRKLPNLCMFIDFLGV